MENFFRTQSDPLQTYKEEFEEILNNAFSPAEPFDNFLIKSPGEKDYLSVMILLRNNSPDNILYEF